MGYSGWFDALKVDEDILDKLYEFDLAMMDGATKIGTLIDQLGQGIADEMPVAEPADTLIAELEALNSTFGMRQDVFLQ